MIEFILLGIFAGFISGFLGIGGGTILVPILLYIGFNMKEAISISITQMVFSSLFGSYLNYKKGLLKLNKGIFLGLGGASGAAFSGYIVSHIDEIVLKIIFLSLVGFSILKFFYSPHKSKTKEIDNIFIFFLVGFLVGILAISVGVGGAVLLTPILVGFLNYDVKKAVSLSLFFVVFSSISGFLSLSFYFQIPEEAFIIAISALIGVYIGINISQKTSSKNHKNILLIWYILVFILIINKL